MLMMFIPAILVLFLRLASTNPTAEVCKRQAPAPFSDFNNNAVFYPGADFTSWRTIYARSLQLGDGSLLTTWENYPPEPPLVTFPIYRSTDGGATWSNFSQVSDELNGWGLRYQPFLYTLPQGFGDYPTGTILIVGASVPSDLSEAYIDVYASHDQAATWEFVSHIAYGPGPEVASNGDNAIWEPFFLTYNDQLVCFYSDQRDPAHGQKLVYVTTTDLRTWTDPVDAVADPDYNARPGMAVVAHIESTNQYIMTYENCGPASCAANYKVASSPLDFGSVQGTQIVSNDSSRTTPLGSPYVVWTLHPHRTEGSGIIIMNGNSQESVFINEDAADPDGWLMVDVGQWSAYSRALNIIDVEGQKRLMISNGGNMGDGANNWVAVGVVDISKFLA
ncbi:hypothetical protein N7458_005917 [Neofusicoccum parvum]|uniref:Uncharacterized protein n=1 Tax=Neofusicoccum parvum TaxID=310453 RepID=A0ACB5SPU4_9PEZI|nr:hypothetical protein N7458_005917 [Neofusicoccum parvum]